MLTRRYSFLLSLLLLLTGLFVVSQSGGFEPNRFFTLLAILVTEGWIPLLWIAGAAGWGWLAARTLLSGDSRSLSVQMVLGVGFQLLMDWSLSWTIGLTREFCWGLNAVGCGLLAFSLRATGQQLRGQIERLDCGIEWAVSFLPLSLLVGACTIPPGILWPSEYGGYDVLEYHLQLPKEWMELGRMTGLQHNAYSFLPNLIESGYLHMALLKGSAIEAAYAAQLFNAAMALLAARLVGRTAVDMAASVSRADHTPREYVAHLVSALYLAVPWTLVTGSIAYTEQTMMAFAAGALLLALKGIKGTPAVAEEFCRGAGVGVLCGFSILAKLSASLLIAVPVFGVGLAYRGREIKRSVLWIWGFLSLALPVVALWLTRNFLWTGNPFFPMLPDWFGTAHWTAGQAARWGGGHSSVATLAQRVLMLFSGSHGVFHPQYGWVLLPAVGISVWFHIRRRLCRKALSVLVGLLFLQMVLWMALTHLMSRFLLPILLPVCILIGLALTSLNRRLATVSATALVVLMTGQAFRLYWSVRDGRTGLFIDGIPLLQNGFEPNRTLNQLPSGSKIYAEGFATPFYVKPPMSYHTVWDTSQLGEAMARGGEQGARDWLRRQGYTHLLIDWYMLGLYWRPGGYGYDPHITASGLTRLIQTGFREVHVDPGRSLVILEISS
jgi:hypothetical protein